MIDKILFALYSWRVLAFMAVHRRIKSLSTVTATPREKFAVACQRLAVLAQKASGSVHKAAWAISPVHPCDLCGTHYGETGYGDMLFCERHAEAYSHLPLKWLDAVDAAEACNLISRDQSNSIMSALCFIADSGNPDWKKIGTDYLVKSGAITASKRLGGVSRLQPSDVEKAAVQKRFAADVAKIRAEGRGDTLSDEQMARLMVDIALDKKLVPEEASDVAADLVSAELSDAEIDVLTYLGMQRVASGGALYVAWDTIKDVAALKGGPVAIRDALDSLVAKKLVLKMGKPAIMGEAWCAAINIASGLSAMQPSGVPVPSPQSKEGKRAALAERKARAGFQVISGGASTKSTVDKVLVTTDGDDEDGGVA
jgi:hypothetical protein